jgi:Tfp pilus assembly protein PilX
MNKQSTLYANARRQRGAALVVSMILLMVLTLLAISGMSTATLELQMAGNAQYSENAFQASETGIEEAMRDAREKGANTSNVDPKRTEVVPGSTTDHYTIETLHDPFTGVSNVPVEAGAFSMGEGGKGYQAFHFEVTSTGTSSRSATETHVQSFYVVAK